MCKSVCYAYVQTSSPLSTAMLTSQPQRLMKEVKAWHRLEHPNVARLHGIVQLPNTIAMVSSWCENGTIVKYLRETNPEANRLQLVSSVLVSVTFYTLHRIPHTHRSTIIVCGSSSRLAL